ncbi:hypothetical protein ACFQ80_05565 [Isoptericola sp. NPDC056578]|uniref:hypothetical protein n=1 Tax=Isoptericola sp. NPDC056578 TaxID=3345870 RepID=UPI00369A9D12
MPTTRRPRALPIDTIYLHSLRLRLPAPMHPTWAMYYLLAVTVSGATGAILLARWTDATFWLSAAVGVALSVLTALAGRHLATAWWRSRPPLENPVSWLCQRALIRFDLDYGWIQAETCDGPSDLRVQLVCSYCTQIETANWCQDCIDTATQTPRQQCTACGRPVTEVQITAGTR